MIRFQVSDTGVGIHAEGLRDLFVPFSRVSNGETTEVTGTGLGLYISKNLVELHHGKMWVESERGVGTTVKPKSTEGMTMQQRERAIGAREGDGPGTIWGRGGPVSVFSCRGETL